MNEKLNNILDGMKEPGTVVEILLNGRKISLFCCCIIYILNN